MNFLLKLSAVSCFIVASITLLPSQPSSQTQDDEKLVLPARDPDRVSRRDFMRTKLMYTQNILEGLTTGDLDGVEEAIKEVQRVTQAEQWIEIDNEQYRKLTGEFKVSTKRLMAAAKTRNIDAIALRYYNMATNCIDCHKHVRNAGYEF